MVRKKGENPEILQNIAVALWLSRICSLLAQRSNSFLDNTF